MFLSDRTLWRTIHVTFAVVVVVVVVVLIIVVIVLFMDQNSCRRALLSTVFAQLCRAHRVQLW